MKNRKNLIIIGACAALAILIGAVSYAVYASGRVSVDTAEISAPLIALSPQGSGTLEELDVQAGDVVPADFVVARVGTELVKTSVAGEIVEAGGDIGKLVNRGEAVVTMIDPRELRLVARVGEDKGLESVRVGQTVRFTVDAFGSKRFLGIVDEISPTSRASGIAFSISDKRETKEFEVKIRFNADLYPELKNGMSAKAAILKN
jgi:multidrug resistance efflux pump